MAASNEAKTAKRTNVNKRLIGILVQLVFTFGFPLIGPFSTVTDLGVRVIGIFLGAIAGLIIGNDMSWPAWIAIVSLALHGYYQSGTAAVAAVLGHPVVVQLIFVTALAHAINSSGAGEVIANKFLRIGFIQGRPILMSIMLILAWAIAANFMGGFVLLFIAYPILNDLLDQAKIDRGSLYANLMRVGIFCAAFVAPTIKGPIDALSLSRMTMFNEALAAYGASGVNNTHYIIVCAVTLLVFYILLPFCFKYLFRADMDNLKNTDFRKLEGMGVKKFTAEQIILLAAFFVYALYGYICKIFPADSVIYAKLTAIGLPAWGIVCILILNCIRIKGKPIFDNGKIFKEGVNWGLCFIMGTFTVIGSALTSAETGIQPWLSSLAGPLFEGKPVVIIIFLLVAATTIVTNFFSNTATGTIFAAIAIGACMPFMLDGRINPTVLALACNVCSMCAYMTWSACGASPILLGEKGVTNKFIWTHGLVVLLIFILTCTVVFSIANVIL